MADIESFLILVNPTSGRGRGRRVAEGVADILRRAGRACEVHHTVASGDARRTAAERCAAGSAPKCLVACGGDGTIQEVAHALAEHRRQTAANGPILGLAPAGRCNDFGRALGVSREIEAIADVLLHGVIREIDLGRVNDRWFCTVATLGIDAEVSRFVDGMKMPLTGTLAYLYGAIRVLMRYRPTPLRISGDFGVIDQPVFLASSANTSSYGGAIPIAPDAVPTDGLLDLCVINQVSICRALGLIRTVMCGRHAHHPDVRFIRTNRITIEAEQPTELWADGEPIATTPATVEVVPAAVRVILPNEA